MGSPLLDLQIGDLYVMRSDGTREPYHIQLTRLLLQW